MMMFIERTGIVSDCCLFTKAALLLLFAEQRDAHLTRIISIITQSRWQLIPRYICAPPNAVRFASPACVLPPPMKWLSGTWKLTNSTLPRWRKARDVTTNYALIPSPAAVTGEETFTLQYGTQLEDFMFWQEPCGSSVTYRSAMGLSKPIRPGGKANGELMLDLYGDTFHHGERTSLVYTRRGNG